MYKINPNISIILIGCVLQLGASNATHASGLNINVNVGAPPPPVAVYAPPAPVPQLALPATPPQFIFIQELGYYVAVDTNYDIAYIGNDYFIYSNGHWYQTPYYGGPLIKVSRRMLPPQLARHSYGEFRRFRDVEFRRYSHNREHYRGKVHKPEMKNEERPEVRKEERREMRREERPDTRREERRFEERR